MNFQMSENFCEIAYAECELTKFKKHERNSFFFFFTTTAVEQFMIAKTRKSTCIKDAIL